MQTWCKYSLLTVAFVSLFGCQAQPNQQAKAAKTQKSVFKNPVPAPDSIEITPYDYPDIQRKKLSLKP